MTERKTTVSVVDDLAINLKKMTVSDTPLLSDETTKHIGATTIQAWWRGVNLRKQLVTLNDNYTLKILNRRLDIYINGLILTDELNKLMSKKKIV